MFDGTNSIQIGSQSVCDTRNYRFFSFLTAAIWISYRNHAGRSCDHERISACERTYRTMGTHTESLHAMADDIGALFPKQTSYGIRNIQKISLF